jgi:hypothetical protein
LLLVGRLRWLIITQLPRPRTATPGLTKTHAGEPGLLAAYPAVKLETGILLANMFAKCG